MANPFQTLLRLAAERWQRVRDPGPAMPKSGVLVHDPKAAGPHDLDDAFFDPKVQGRVASVIAGAATKKRDANDAS